MEIAEYFPLIVIEIWIINTWYSALEYVATYLCLGVQITVYSIEGVTGSLQTFYDNKRMLIDDGKYKEILIKTDTGKERVDAKQHFINTLVKMKDEKKPVLATKPTKPRTTSVSSNPETAYFQEVMEYIKKNYKKELQSKLSSMFWKDKKVMPVKFTKAKDIKNLKQAGSITITIPRYYRNMANELIRRVNEPKSESVKKNVAVIRFPIIIKDGKPTQTKSVSTSNEDRTGYKVANQPTIYLNTQGDILFSKFQDRPGIEKTAENVMKYIYKHLQSIQDSDEWKETIKDSTS